AEAGLVGIAFNSAPAVVVAPGGTRAILSSNPLSVGIPRTGSPPLLLGMATSAGTFNLVVLAQRTGAPLPAGVAVDAAGAPTTDPFAAVEETGRPRLLPFGGHKGFGLAFMIELLCGASLGAPIGEEKRTPFIHEPAHFTGLYLTYRPDLFVAREEFDDRVEQLVRDVKASASTPDMVIRLPGEESQRRKARLLERGTLDLDEATWEFLTS
ncbi:MAG: Ldh family oxidoreductase, partial [Chloroflexota bacterium]|nr:Ldh family oxidoreductase [Chloroflexota bacterium]